MEPYTPLEVLGFVLVWIFALFGAVMVCWWISVQALKLYRKYERNKSI